MDDIYIITCTELELEGVTYFKSRILKEKYRLISHFISEVEILLTGESDNTPLYTLSILTKNSVIRSYDNILYEDAIRAYDFISSKIGNITIGSKSPSKKQKNRTKYKVASK